MCVFAGDTWDMVSLRVWSMISVMIDIISTGKTILEIVEVFDTVRVWRWAEDGEEFANIGRCCPGCVVEEAKGGLVKHVAGEFIIGVLWMVNFS